MSQSDQPSSQESDILSQGTFQEIWASLQRTFSDPTWYDIVHVKIVLGYLWLVSLISIFQNVWVIVAPFALVEFDIDYY